jgi:hypothetical protein
MTASWPRVRGGHRPIGKTPIVEKPSEPHFIDFMGLPGRVDNFKILFFPVPSFFLGTRAQLKRG